MKEIFQNLASIIRPKQPGHIVGNIYAINSGKFIGEFFVLVEKTNTEYRFLSLPKMLRRVVPAGDMDRGIQNNIIAFVKRLPKDIFEVCSKQYFHNKTVDKKSKADK